MYIKNVREIHGDCAIFQVTSDRFKVVEIRTGVNCSLKLITKLHIY